MCEGNVHRDFCAFVHPEVFFDGASPPALSAGGLALASSFKLQPRTGAILGTGSPVSRVPYVGIRRVSVVRLITDIDPLETIPAPAGAVVASCCGER